MNGVCDSCKRQRESRSACSALGPVTLAYCRECAANYAEPAKLCDLTVDMVGGHKNINEAITGDITVFIDGAYVPFSDYIKEKK